MSDDLRTLAQAVVSAYEILQGERTASVGRDYDVIDDCRTRYHAACKAVDAALALPGLRPPGTRRIAEGQVSARNMIGGAS